MLKPIEYVSYGFDTLVTFKNIKEAILSPKNIAVLVVFLGACSVEHDTPTALENTNNDGASDTSKNTGQSFDPQDIDDGSSQDPDDSSSGNGPDSFSLSYEDIKPALVSSCGACHSSPSAKWQTEDPAKVRTLVNLDNPAQSSLLLKGENSIAHGGGKKWSAGDTNYDLVLSWIEQGAL